jgi:hypothetical protein
VSSPKDTAIITPNSDTPYSLPWLDLRAEPIVLSVPAVEKSRYYSVMLEDGNTFIYGYIGSRATGSEAGDYMVVGPDWKGEVPEGIKKIFHSGTQFSLVAYRTQLFNPEDMPNVVKIQSGHGVKPLSGFLGQPAPGPAPTIDFPNFDKELVKTKFFDYLEYSLQFAPAGPEEKEIRAKLARIGVGPDKTFDFDTLSPEQKQAVAADMKAGEAKIAEYLKTQLINSPMLPDMKKNADGSMTLYIQKDSPGAEKESNWLPAPDGPIYLAMRLYWPRKESPTILPIGKGEWKPPFIVEAKLSAKQPVAADCAMAPPLNRSVMWQSTATVTAI